jgi:superfamily II DNA or RNA helicase
VDFEYLQGRLELRGLEPFQIEVKNRMIEVLTSRNGRAVVTLPTGAGKTRTAVEGLREWLAARHSDQTCALQNVVLWLAHTEELCEQAYASFRDVWENSAQACPLFLFRFWGGYTADLVRHKETLVQAMREASVFISTPQRFANLIREATDEAREAVGRLRNSVGAVVIDEAHRAAAPSYQQILSLFEGVGNAAVIGLTATPFRTEYADDGLAGTLHLARLFESQIVEPSGTLGADPRTRLQEMGVLALPVLESLETHVRLTLPSALRRGDLAQEDMEKADAALRLRADASAARRLRLAERIAEVCADRAEHSVLYFGPSVADAASVAFLLRERGHRAAFVSGNTPEAVRRRLIQEFRDGQVRVLCNCEVLTTGFDAPRVTHVVVGRPTVSQVLYEQMVGRGLRGPKFGGTEHCVIVNCKDDYREGSPRLGWVDWRDAWKPEER